MDLLARPNPAEFPNFFQSEINLSYNGIMISLVFKSGDPR